MKCACPATSLATRRLAWGPFRAPLGRRRESVNAGSCDPGERVRTLNSSRRETSAAAGIGIRRRRRESRAIGLRASCGSVYIPFWALAPPHGRLVRAWHPASCCRSQGLDLPPAPRARIGRFGEGWPWSDSCSRFYPPRAGGYGPGRRERIRVRFCAPRNRIRGACGTHNELESFRRNLPDVGYPTISSPDSYCARLTGTSGYWCPTV